MTKRQNIFLEAIVGDKIPYSLILNLKSNEAIAPIIITIIE